MIILKRNEEKSELVIHEIREALQWATKGLDLSYLELESHVDSIYTNRITTKEIQSSLINIALRLTSVEKPEWRFVAARLLLMEYYKEAAHHRKYTEFGYSGNYLSFLTDAVTKGLYDEKILKAYSPDEIENASHWILPEYDLSFDYAGINALTSRYLIKDNNKAYELPQELFLTIALYLAIPEKRDRIERARQFYHLIASRKISLATPILINLRRKKGNLSSCFITAMDDNLTSIFYNINHVAQISKNGGGVGVNLSRVRSCGAQIQGVNNAAGGVIPWIRILNDTAVAVNQLGKRAGAVTAALDVWHRDLEEFLLMQTENGDQRKKAYDIFPQLVIPDLFLQRVEKKETWTLFDPHEIRSKTKIELAELWGEDFEKAYTDLEKRDEILLSKKVSAREIFKIILKTMIETGMPYLFFKDTVNRLNPNQHDGYIGNGNLCQESFSNFRPTPFENGSPMTDRGLIHTCNLVSLNLAILVGKHTLQEACESAVRILDNTIDLTVSPVEESNNHNRRYRAIGVGAMGLADYLAYHQIPYEDSAEKVAALFEDIAFYTTSASAALSKERGPIIHSGEVSGKKVFFSANQKNTSLKTQAVMTSGLNL